MKKYIFTLLILGATLLQSCRETEMNTDGDMEEAEKEVGNKKDRPAKKYLAEFQTYQKDLLRES